MRSMLLPEIILQHDVVEGCQRASNSVVQTIQEPLDPTRDIESFIACDRLQGFVITNARPLDSGRHGVKPLCAAATTCKCHVGDCTGYAAVAITERMDGYKPEMGDSCFDERINIMRFVEPFEEGRHLSLYVICRWCNVVNFLVSECAGNDLHTPA